MKKSTIPADSKNTEISEIMQSLRRIIKTLQDYSHEVSAQFGITGPQLWALKIIRENGGLSLGDLSQRMYVHPSTVSGLIDRLENKGYVSRDRSQQDRRVVNVDLTPKGSRLAKSAPHPVQGRMIYGLRKLKDEELDRIHDSIRRLVEIMEAQNVKVTFFFDEQ